LEVKELNADWWIQLEPQWKQAFGEAFFNHQDAPSADELSKLYSTRALRFAGPSAPYPNMKFELSNLSGVASLPNLEILVVTHHIIETITEISTLSSIKSLFLFNNRISSIEPLAELTILEQLYVQSNKIESILPVQKLINLKELYINDNSISSLEGLTEEHADHLIYFFCKPNEGLKQKEMIRIERELGIKCRSL